MLRSSAAQYVHRNGECSRIEVQEQSASTPFSIEHNHHVAKSQVFLFCKYYDKYGVVSLRGAVALLSDCTIADLFRSQLSSGSFNNEA
jgi:hypothetical protein